MEYNYSVLISSFPHPSAFYMCLSRSKEAKSVWVNTCEERKSSESSAFNTFQLVPPSGKKRSILTQHVQSSRLSLVLTFC